MTDAPVPQGPWVMQQRWHHLLFAHWPVPVAAVRPHVPDALAIDTYDDTAWVSVIPFYMTGVRFRAVPPIPTAHAFAELNVRTYVTHATGPGIWFFSLDAESTLAVIGARIGARLPYYRASMEVTLSNGEMIGYRSERLSGQPPCAAFAATYGADPIPVAAPPGSLAYFLAERYTLFTHNEAKLWRIDIHHPRWALYGAQAEIVENTMMAAAGLATPDREPLLHYAAHQDVRFWWPAAV